MKKATTYQSELIIKANIDLPYEEHLNHILQITHKVKKDFTSYLFDLPHISVNMGNFPG